MRGERREERRGERRGERREERREGRTRTKGSGWKKTKLTHFFDGGKKGIASGNRSDSFLVDEKCHTQEKCVTCY